MKCRGCCCCCWSYGSYVALHRVRHVMDELNRLRLNPSKTELICVLGTSRRLQHCDGFNMTVCGADVRPVDCVRDLGVLIDSNMTLSNHVNNVAGICFYQLYASYVSSDGPWRQMLHTRWFGPWSIPELTTVTDSWPPVLSIPAREVTVRPPCRRQTCFAAPTSFVCFRNYARTVALARDARSCPIQTVYPCIQMSARTRSFLPVWSLRACHSPRSSEIICDTRTVAVNPPDENYDVMSAWILLCFVCRLERTPIASARPWTIAEQLQN